MREVEVKARIRDLAAIEATLEARGVTLSVPVTQDDAIYVREVGTLQTFLDNQLFLRIRELSSGKARFTAKFNPNRNAEQDMVAEEHETEIGSREDLEHILRLLGFTCAVRVRKSRRSGRHGAYEFCLDEVEGLGSFIEIEKLVSEEAEVSAAHDELLAVLAELGVEPQDRFTKRYDVMMLEKLSP